LARLLRELREAEVEKRRRRTMVNAPRTNGGLSDALSGNSVTQERVTVTDVTRDFERQRPTTVNVFLPLHLLNQE
jgi:hypothetical protein